MATQSPRSTRPGTRRPRSTPAPPGHELAGPAIWILRVMNLVKRLARFDGVANLHEGFVNAGIAGQDQPVGASQLHESRIATSLGARRHDLAFDHADMLHQVADAGFRDGHGVGRNHSPAAQPGCQVELGTGSDDAGERSGAVEIVTHQSDRRAEGGAAASAVAIAAGSSWRCMAT